VGLQRLQHGFVHGQFVGLRGSHGNTGFLACIPGSRER
jgi:hypothetical protein